MSLFLLLLCSICLFTGVIAFFDSRIKRNKFYYTLMFFIIIFYAFIVANRPSELLDTKSYYNIYNTISAELLHDFSFITREYTTGVEYGFILLLLPFKWLHVNIKMVFFVITLVEIIIFFISMQYLLRKQNNTNINYYFLFLVFVIMFGLYYQCIAFRSGISLVLSFALLVLIMKKRFIVSGVLLLFMFSIHRTSLLALLPIMIYLSKIQFLTSIYYGICTVVSVLLILTYGSSYVYELSNYIFTFIFDELSIDYRGYFQENVTATSLAMINVYYIICSYITIVFNKGKKIIQDMNLSTASLISVYLTLYVSGAKRIFDFFAIYYVLVFL